LLEALPNAAHFQSFLDLGICRHAGRVNILPYSAIEQEMILEYDINVGANLVQGEVSDIDSIDYYFA